MHAAAQSLHQTAAGPRLNVLYLCQGGYVLPLFISRITRKAVNELFRIFWRVVCATSNSRLDFPAAADHDTHTGNVTTVWWDSSTKSADNSTS